MALTDHEKKQVLNALDEIDDAFRFVVLASLDAFAKWLASVLYGIYVKVKNTLNTFWNWLCSQDQYKKIIKSTQPITNLQQNFYETVSAVAGNVEGNLILHPNLKVFKIFRKT
ncbi:hypothetical protein H6G81_05030 [Scytonema hofmannii FACHB-248]|uniref:Uncharacterized protein n=1 Tax=Scytonema hofmannii FACHB-248 TaxID=1842502 RepID=A0ABR8GKJ8_9CYAN|nr:MULTISPECIES: hypothetical protein [Nostocales]MBD2603912.1 hypothetical protein [Scytonema hofmannii FACHB-248]